MSETRTFRDAVARQFMLRRGEWIDARELMQVGGQMAWRTRTSECRTQLGMDIRNRTRRVGDVRVSEYRFTGSAVAHA